MSQRRLDFLVEQRHHAVQNVDQIEQHVLALVDHRQTLARMLLGLPDAGDFRSHAGPERVHLGARGSRVGPLQQVMRDVLLLAQNGASRGFGRMCREHRLDAHLADELHGLRQRHPGALQAADAIGDAARLRGARIAQVFAAPAHAVRLFRGIDRHEPNGERPRKIGGGRRRAAGRAVLQIGGALRVAFAPLERGDTIALDQIEELFAALIAKRLADQAAQRMHILAQRGVLDRKLNALAIHNARLSRRTRRNSMSLLAQIAIFLAAAVIAIPIFRRFKLGSVLGYLTAGIIIGPASLGLISSVEATQDIAQFGIVLLMFVIGLELQPSRLWVLRRSIFGLGSAQVAGDHDRRRRGRLFHFRANLASGAGHGLCPVDVLDRAGAAAARRARPAQLPVRPLRLQHPAVSGRLGAARAGAAAAARAWPRQNPRDRAAGW